MDRLRRFQLASRLNLMHGTDSNPSILCLSSTRITNTEYQHSTIHGHPTDLYFCHKVGEISSPSNTTYRHIRHKLSASPRIKIKHASSHGSRSSSSSCSARRIPKVRSSIRRRNPRSTETGRRRPKAPRRERVLEGPNYE